MMFSRHKEPKIPDHSSRNFYLTQMERIAEAARETLKTGIEKNILIREGFVEIPLSTLEQFGSGLWKRITENWEIADWIAKDHDRLVEAHKFGAVKNLAYNEAFLLRLSEESGVWKNWCLGEKNDICIGSVPPTMLYDDRFIILRDRRERESIYRKEMLSRLEGRAVILGIHNISEDS